jgi:hypothetical protein
VLHGRLEDSTSWQLQSDLFAYSLDLSGLRAKDQEYVIKADANNV